MRVRTAVGLAVTALGGCAGGGASVSGDTEVPLLLPLSRFESPEPSPRFVGVGAGFESTPRLMLTGNQLDHAPDPDSPKRESAGALNARFDLQFGAPLTLSALTREGGVPMGQLKWNAVRAHGTGANSLALTAGYGENDDTYAAQRTCSGAPGCNPTNAETAVDRSIADASLILGHRFSRWWLLYGGPYFSRLDYGVRHFSDRGSNADVATEFEDRVQMIGMNFGAMLAIKDSGRLLWELSVADVRYGQDRYTASAIGVTHQFYLGPRTPTGAQ